MLMPDMPVSLAWMRLRSHRQQANGRGKGGCHSPGIAAGAPVGAAPPPPTACAPLPPGASKDEGQEQKLCAGAGTQPIACCTGEGVEGRTCPASRSPASTGLAYPPAQSTRVPQHAAPGVAAGQPRPPDWEPATGARASRTAHPAVRLAPLAPRTAEPANPANTGDEGSQRCCHRHRVPLYTPAGEATTHFCTGLSGHKLDACLGGWPAGGKLRGACSTLQLLCPLSHLGRQRPRAQW